MEKSFDGQREGEDVVLVFRRHIIAMRKGFYSLLTPFVIASLPSLIWPGELVWLWVALGGLGVGLLLFFYHWVGWYFTVFILTTQRLRQVTQKSFFGTSVIDLNISKIQNISYTIPGFSAEVFGFGTIIIQTYVGDLILDLVHHPNEVYNKLQDVAADATQKGGNDDEEIDT